MNKLQNGTTQEKIRVGILGYGNLGRGVELALNGCDDMELVAVFTRREPETISTIFPATKVLPERAAFSMAEKIDVMILCGGSATDLMVQSPAYAAHFHIVDSFDTHAKIPEHFAAVNSAAKSGGKAAVISAGWDPGLFSINRLYAGSVLPQGKDYTFWGKGVSQGHSDALRRIPGVKAAIQYTVPVASALEGARSGGCPDYCTRDKHTRECFVVPAPGADLKALRNTIVNMPNYFDEYNTTVCFMSMDEFNDAHKTMAHGGFVIRSGQTGLQGETKHSYEFSLSLGSNPEFTAGVLVAYGRAAFKMAADGFSGAKTVLEIAPCYLSPAPIEELHRCLL